MTTPLARSARRSLLVALAALAAGCTERVVAPAVEQPPTEPGRTLGTSADDFASFAAVFGETVFLVGQTAGSLDGPNQGNLDAFVRRYHPEGEVLWRDQFGTPLDDWARAVAVDAAGNAYVVGVTYGSLAGSRGGIDAFIRKYGSSGSVEWTRQFGGPLFDGVIGVSVDGSGNVYVAGTVETAAAFQDAVVRKFSPGGDLIWLRQFGTAESDLATGVANDAAGNVYVSVFTTGRLQGTYRGGGDGAVRAYSSAGNHLWTRQFGTTEYDWPAGIAVAADGAVVVVGETAGVLHGSGAGGYDAFIRKYSSTGTLIVTRQFGTAANDGATALSVDGLGNVYVTGITYGMLAGAGNAGETDVFIRKYNSSNGVVWTRQFGTSGFDQLPSIATSSDGAVIYVAGGTSGTLAGSNQGGFDGFLRRLDANGNHVWTDQ